MGYVHGVSLKIWARQVSVTSTSSSASTLRSLVLYTSSGSEMSQNRANAIDVVNSVPYFEWIVSPNSTASQ